MIEQPVELAFRNSRDPGSKPIHDVVSRASGDNSRMNCRIPENMLS